MAVKDTPRRTQQQRREQTIRKLLEATRESLIEEGYANTSIQQVCRRSGISHGGLFRHFRSRIDLMIATAKDVSDSLIELYKEKFARLSESGDSFRLALLLLRDNCRARDNQAWFELIMAARSDADLRVAMVPIWQENRQQTLAFACAAFPELARDRESFAAFVDCVVNQFHGEAVNAYVCSENDADRQRLDCMEGIVKEYAGLPRDTES